MSNEHQPRRGPGRPRKWASEAERKRAYRERLAAELAEPAELRRRLRAAEKRIRQLEQANVSLERDLGRSTRHLAHRSNELVRAAAEVDRLGAEVRELWDRINGGMW